MMKNEQTNDNKAPPPSSNRYHKILGGDSGVSFVIVGGIVEKGFSQNTPSSLPRPTVLPFPVARHRSHGPQCASKGIAQSDICDDEDVGEEAKYAAFAKPIQRKQNKAVDFSKWRELIKDSSSGPSIKANGKVLAQNQQLNIVSEATGIHENLKNSLMDVENTVHICRSASASDSNTLIDNMEVTSHDVVIGQEPDISDMDIDGVPSSLGNNEYISEDDILQDTRTGYSELSEKQTDADLNNHYMSKPLMPSKLGYNNSVNEQGASTLASQIDTENRARLARMSADEIAEAQAELRKKMNPALLEKIRNRGQNKLNKQEITPPDIGNSSPVDIMADEIFSSNKSKPSKGDISRKLKILDSTQTGIDDSLVQEDNPTNSSRETWSKRVEVVWDLRLSLEGDVIESDVQLPNAGNISVTSACGDGNFSEHDFLRTEGDPAAAGYTIKEALTLL